MLLPLLLAATLTIEDHATMPRIETPRWSPDGTRVAYVLTKADLGRNVYDSDVWVVDADGRNDRQLTRGSGADIQPRWSPDGKRIAFLSDRSGRPSIHVIDVDGGEAAQLTREPAPIRELAWSPDGTAIAFTRIDAATPEDDGPRAAGERTRHVHLYSVRVESGKVHALTSGDFTVFGFSWAPDGSSIAFDRGSAPGLDGLYDADIYSISCDGTMKPLVVRPSIDRGPVYSPDGKSIAFTSGGGNPDWIVEHDVHVVPADGGATRMISGGFGRTAESLAWSKDSRAVYIEGPWNTTTQIFRLTLDDEAGGSALNCEPHTRCDGVVRDVDMNADRAAYVFESLTEPPELYVDRRRITRHNDALRERQLGETRVIRWKNPKDGLEIEGLLTLPIDHVKGTRVPLLTFAHGGPASRFDQSFLGYLGPTYAPNTLAALGYAVLRPNPRGSDGYGVAFRRANRNDWGGMDWLDVNAGIDKVIADGIADPKRLGFMGWSYGGFLGAWALAHSERFLAVSIGAPMTDLLTMQATSDTHGYVPAYFPGMPLERIQARSPAWQLRKKPNAKILIQQGESDERVPISQGTLFYQRLRDLGADVTMVVYPRMGHGTRDIKVRMDIMRRNVELFRSAIPVTRSEVPTPEGQAARAPTADLR